MSVARPRRGRMGGSRRRRPPAAVEESIEIHTSDGVALRASALPRSEGAPAAGTAVLAHAMFARRGEFVKPAGRSLADLLRSSGFDVVAFDFRGHGESSGKDARWTYDDLVARDLPAVVDCARAREDGRLVVVGHSLGGHVALAAQGLGLARADAIVCVAANVWLWSLERSRVRWLAKRVIAEVGSRAVARLGRVPARALRLGSDDESAEYMQSIFAPARTGRWVGAGGEDYLAALAAVDVPVAQIVSDGDRLNCHPGSGAAFARLAGGPVHVEHVRGSRREPAPDHMQLVTGVASMPAVREAWERALAWVRART
ncbi:MAG: alpha/beta fold hydrolase [Myxococcales bacterium]|nr:alpha/beta fold hydrolase [Myxococcales bacterium]